MVPEHLTDVPLIAPLLFLSTLVLNVPVTRNAFIDFDDDTRIVSNTHVQAGLTWNTVKWSFQYVRRGELGFADAAF